MAKILAAMDVSGNPNVGNHEFLSIILCTQQYLDCLKKKLKSKRVRLDVKNSTTRNLIASELAFEYKDVLALCCRINRDDIINKILRQKTKHRKQPMRHLILRSFNRQVYALLQDKISTFLISKKCDRDEVKFQCDGDCVGFAKDVGLSHIGSNDLHIVADVLAWMNNHGREPPGTVSMDLRNRLQNRVIM